MSVTNPNPFALVKSFASLLLLVCILLVGLGSWLWPRQPTISADAVKNLESVTQQLKRVADNMESTAQATAQNTELLGRQLQERQGETDETYKKLIKDYGYDLGLSATDQPTGLYSPAVYLGGDHVPPSAGRDGAVKRVQGPGESDKGTPHPSGTPAAKQESRAAAQQPG